MGFVIVTINDCIFLSTKDGLKFKFKNSLAII
jgi:hypothetical protein